MKNSQNLNANIEGFHRDSHIAMHYSVSSAYGYSYCLHIVDGIMHNIIYIADK